MKEPKIYRGIDLLDMIFEFVEMTPNSDLWTLNAQKGNQPRLIRLKQINSLLSAFFQTNKPNGFLDKAKQLFLDNKNETIQTILSGDFLNRQNITEFTEIIKFIRLIVNEKENSEIEDREIHIMELKMTFQQLIKYKEQLRKLLTFNSGWLEASSITSRFSIYLTDSISKNLRDKYSELDKALEILINPKNFTFTESELIDNYNFPKDDLNEIDMENW